VSSVSGFRLQATDRNIRSSSSNDIIMDDTHPNIEYSTGFPCCTNNLNPQYFNSTFQ
jgi:hypothetical protein